MWFIFGFISAISFMLFFGTLRYLSKWKGESIRVGELWGQYRIYRHGGRVQSINIGCGAEKHIDFTIKPERWWDRLAKAFGLTTEHKVGCEYFDKQYYLMSDHINLCYTFRTNKELRELADELFSLAEQNSLKLKAIKYRFSRIWVELDPKKGESPSNGEFLAKQFLPKLNSFADMMYNSTSIRGKGLRDPFALKAAIVLAISTGLAANALFHLIRVDVFSDVVILDPKALEILSFKAAGFIIAVFIAGTLFVLGRTARTHMVLAEVVTIGFLGAWGTSYFFIRDLNIDFDESVETAQTTHIVRKYATGGKSRSYYFILKDWNTNGEIEVNVTSRRFRSFEAGNQVRVAQREGRLGIRWTEKINHI